MGRLRLELDHLRVESFDTLPGSRARGTVLGHGDFADVAVDNLGQIGDVVGGIHLTPGCPNTNETCNASCGTTCQSCASACIPTACGYTCPVQVCDPPPPTYPGCTVE